MFDTKELLKLADRLDAWAIACDAKAKVHLDAKESGPAEMQQLRAENHRHYSGVCRNAARLLSSRNKAAAFQPPTLAEVIAFVASEADLRGWPEADIRSWWNHFESQGWKVTGRAPMKNWHAAARNGCARWRERNGKPAASGKAPRRDADPEGWREWCASQKPPLPYTEFRYARDYHQKEFNDRKK